MTDSALATVPFIRCGPEAMLRVDSVTGTSERTTGVMQLGAWSGDESGATTAGALGVLVDDVFGYPLVAAGPSDHWSVSTSIFVDFCGPLPGPGEELRAESTTLVADAVTAVGRGRIFDSRGALVAEGSQRSRFVPGRPDLGSDGRTIDAAWLDRVGIATVLSADLSVDLETATGSFIVGPELMNPLGNLHGGISFAFAETIAQRLLRAGGSEFTTSSVHVSYVRPLVGGSLVTADATLRYSGRTLAIADVTLRNPAGKPAVIASVTGSSH